MHVKLMCRKVPLSFNACVKNVILYITRFFYEPNIHRNMSKPYYELILLYSQLIHLYINNVYFNFNFKRLQLKTNSISKN